MLPSLRAVWSGYKVCYVLNDAKFSTKFPVIGFALEIVRKVLSSEAGRFMDCDIFLSGIHFTAIIQNRD